MGCCLKALGIGSVIVAILVGYVWHKITYVPEIPDIPLGYWGPGKPKPDDVSIKPFSINISEADIADFTARLDNTRELQEPYENVNFEYGFNTKYLRKLIHYWIHDYKWSERQTYLNKFPQFKTQVAGLNIHYIHVKPAASKSKGKKIVPLILLHGWPGSVVEFYEAIDLLTSQTAIPDIVYELVVPSLPGYGWSDGSRKVGLGPAEMGNIFNELMIRLGHKKYFVQGGDWGSFIGSSMAMLHPQNVVGFHSNMCPSLGTLGQLQLIFSAMFPSWVVEEEMVEKVQTQLSFLIEESGYFHIQATKPDTVGITLTDSPAGLAAYILEKFSTWTNRNWKHLPDGGLEKWDKNKILDNVMIYWFSNSITTSMRLYSEAFNWKYTGFNLDNIPIMVPTGCARFHEEIMYLPDMMIRKKFPNLIHLTDYKSGGHFAAFEVPKVLVDDVNAFVKTALTAKPKQ